MGNEIRGRSSSGSSGEIFDVGFNRGQQWLGYEVKHGVSPEGRVPLRDVVCANDRLFSVVTAPFIGGADSLKFRVQELAFDQAGGLQSSVQLWCKDSGPSKYSFLRAGEDVTLFGVKVDDAGGLKAGGELSEVLAVSLGTVSDRVDLSQAKGVRVVAIEGIEAGGDVVLPPNMEALLYGGGALKGTLNMNGIEEGDVDDLAQIMKLVMPLAKEGGGQICYKQEVWKSYFPQVMVPFWTMPKFGELEAGPKASVVPGVEINNCSRLVELSKQLRVFWEATQSWEGCPFGEDLDCVFVNESCIEYRLRERKRFKSKRFENHNIQYHPGERTLLSVTVDEHGVAKFESKAGSDSERIALGFNIGEFDGTFDMSGVHILTHMRVADFRGALVLGWSHSGDMKVVVDKASQGSVLRASEPEEGQGQICRVTWEGEAPGHVDFTHLSQDWRKGEKGLNLLGLDAKRDGAGVGAGSV